MKKSIVTIIALTLLFAVKWADMRKMRSISQTPSKNTEIDTGSRKFVTQKPNTVVQDTDRINLTSKQDGINRKLSDVDGTSFDFVYWNTELGKNKSIGIEFGKEKEIIDFWIRGKPLKVITHGYFSSGNATGVIGIKSGYIATGNYNIITIDWSQISNDIVYPIPAHLTVRVGYIIARFLKNIIKLGLIDPSNIHLIGHSLGAHVFGATGAAFSSAKIGRITGLDPAGPGFENSDWETRPLNSTNAQFVDVIHTSAGYFGYLGPIGHADFYPNLGGVPQPECEYAFPPFEWMTPGICSHTISTKYYIHSVYHRKSFVAVQCHSPEEYVNGKCKYNDKNFMGHDADHNKKGIFFLETHTTTTETGIDDLLLDYFS